MSATFITALLRVMLGNLLLPAPALAATPAHVALVIGNATYTTLPPLPACLMSSHAVAAAARGAGFDVVEREDASGGAMDGAISEFATKLASAPDATTLIYLCGYGTSYENRSFFLPVSANITRPADVLTQGILAKSVLSDALVRGKAGTTMIADRCPAGPISRRAHDSWTQRPGAEFARSHRTDRRQPDPASRRANRARRITCRAVEEPGPPDSTVARHATAGPRDEGPFGGCAAIRPMRRAT